MTNIRKQKQIDASLAEEYDLLRTVIDNMPDYIYVKDTKSRFVISNIAHAQLVGATNPQEMTGKTDFDYFPQKEAAQYYADEQRIVRSGKPLVNREEPVVDSTGDRKWVLTTKVPVRDEGGNTVALVGISRDISEWKRLVDVLSESERRFRLLVSASFEGIVLNENNRVSDANENFARIHGYELSEIIGTEVLEKFVAPESRKLVSDNIASGFEKPYEALHVRRDGSSFPVEICGKTIQSRGRIVRVVAVRDISDRKLAEREKQKLEAQVRHAEMLRSLGILTAGIAHDLNNFMTAISVYSEVLLERLNATDPVARRAAEEIRRVVHRSTSLCRQLLTFGRKQVLQKKEIDLNAVITDLCAMLRSVIGERIRLTTKLDPFPVGVNADALQIQQLIVNLAVNARDAMPDGGKLTIETANVKVDSKYARRQHIRLKPGHYVKLTVTDTGCGMDEGTMERIFEPFFTTKEAGAGTGLGLSTVYGIVKQSEGHISVESELGKGAQFSIFLRSVKQRVDSTKPCANVVERPHGSETVLLVEDEEVVRKSLTLLLEQHGYHVLHAKRGNEALRVAARHAGPIHLLVTDVVMPDLSGDELAECLVLDQPEMKVLYISGYGNHDITRHKGSDRGMNFLHKPFTGEALLRKVRSVIECQGLAQG